MLAQKFDSEFHQQDDEHLLISYQMLPQDEKCILYRLEGTLDNYNAHTFRHKIELALRHGFCRIILDCCQLEYISSTGVGTVTAFLNPLKKHGGSIVFLGVSSGIHQVFTMVGFGHFVTFCDTLEEALQAFSK